MTEPYPVGNPPSAVPERHRVPTHLARRLHQICMGVSAEVIEPAGMTPGEYGLLAAVDDGPGFDQRRLAATLGIDVVSLGQMIDRLETAGWIERRMDPRDRRVRLVSATAEGSALRAKLRPAALRVQERIMSVLSREEQALFLDLLTRIVEGNQAYARPGNGRRKPRRRVEPRDPASPQVPA